MIDKYKKEECPTCESFINRGVAVNCLVLKDKKEILLVKRGIELFKGWWALPGGYVAWDESVEDAAKRELKEETSLDAKSVKLFGVYSDPARTRQTIGLSFEVEAEGSPKGGDDAEEARFFEIDKLPELAFDHGKIVKDFLKNNKQSFSLNKL